MWVYLTSCPRLSMSRHSNYNRGLPSINPFEYVASLTHHWSLIVISYPLVTLTSRILSFTKETNKFTFINQKSFINWAISSMNTTQEKPQLKFLHLIYLLYHPSSVFEQTLTQSIYKIVNEVCKTLICYVTSGFFYLFFFRPVHITI